jgi:type I restriction enzyme R subunit
VCEHLRQLLFHHLPDVLQRGRLPCHLLGELIAQFLKVDRAHVEQLRVPLIVEEGLSEDEYALFCLLLKENISKADREKVKLASRSLLEAVTHLIAQRERWTDKEQTQADVEVLILDHLFSALPSPSFSDDEKQSVAKQVYQHVWQQSASGHFGAAA